jgi:transposase-like protein
MTTKTPDRRHTPEFKLRLCREIRSGQLGRRDAQKKFSLSDNLIHRWLAQYDSEQLQTPVTDRDSLADCEAQVQALERKVGQLTMQLEGLAKKP